VAVLFGVSYLTPPPTAAELACVLPAPSIATETSGSWWQRYRFWLALYLVALVAVYIVFN
jgi:hypothetical protein